VSDETAPSAISRALVPTAALLLLSRQPDHGYALVQRLRTAGFGHVRGGTLYPQLRAMDAAGLIEPEWETDGPGPARKVFRLTAAGSRHLKEECAAINATFNLFAVLEEARS
jgi:PadR family transcriptional regulator, regulatory protein PadR